MIKEEDLSKIGQFAKPHGTKGEISLITDCDISGISSDPYIVCEMDGIWVPFFIESCRQKGSAITLVKFEGINSGENVNILSGQTAYLPAYMIIPNDDDDALNRNYIINYTVIDDNTGVIGRITDVDDSTINILLKVDSNGNEILIPAALVTAIHQENKTTEVSLPEGFLEIYK
jgi:16S rRNA processing protein RimM